MNDTSEQTKNKVMGYLRGEKMAVLSTHAPDGTIDAAAVHFVADEHFNFYFTTKVGTRKYQNFTANPGVALTIPNPETLQTVEMKGTASVVTDNKGVSDTMMSLMEKSKLDGVPWFSPVAKLDAGQFAIIKITPHWLRYGDFLHEEPKGEFFKQIIG